jgi:hypothetical protein
VSLCYTAVKLMSSQPLRVCHDNPLGADPMSSVPPLPPPPPPCELSIEKYTTCSVLTCPAAFPGSA